MIDALRSSLTDAHTSKLEVRDSSLFQTRLDSDPANVRRGSIGARAFSSNLVRSDSLDYSGDRRQRRIRVRDRALVADSLLESL